MFTCKFLLQVENEFYIYVRENFLSICLKIKYMYRVQLKVELKLKLKQNIKWLVCERVPHNDKSLLIFAAYTLIFKPLIFYG